MIKTLNINLGGLAFIIDDNAFELLHNYLEALKQKFVNEAERAEILNDIEARIAEMLQQKIAGNKEVISIEDVQLVMATMGKPEDIAGEEPASQTSSASSSPAQDIHIKRKLFRDPDDAKIGGVISGLCHYFGINDPVWVRIAVVILFFFTWGTVVLLYLLLLIVIPKANTAAEKLQMKGEPVNINTIEKEIKDAANRAGASIHQMIDDENFFEKIWNVIAAILRAGLKIFAVFDIIIAMICLAAVAICFVLFYVLGTSPYNEVSRLLVDVPSTITLFSFGFLLFLATPFIALVYLGLKLLLGQRSKVKWLKSTLLIAWFIGLILLLTSAYKVLINFGQDGLVKRSITLMKPSQGNLYVQLTDSTGKKINMHEDEEEDFNLNNSNGRLYINGTDFNDVDMISIGKPSLQLMPSENDSFYIQEVITAKGKSILNAMKNGNMVIYSLSQSDSLINLRPHLYISKNAKWRNQNMRIRIAIPEGKKVRFADNIDMWAATVKGDANYNDTYFANTVWTVEKGMIKCIEGENHQNPGGEKKWNDAEHNYNKMENKINKLEKKGGGNNAAKENENKEGKGGDF